MPAAQTDWAFRSVHEARAMNATTFTASADPECGTSLLRAFPMHLIARSLLSDGTPISIRPIKSTDKGIELDFLRGLSHETRYQRLLSARELLPGELKR